MYWADSERPSRKAQLSPKPLKPPQAGAQGCPGHSWQDTGEHTLSPVSGRDCQVNCPHLSWCLCFLHSCRPALVPICPSSHDSEGSRAVPSEWLSTVSQQSPMTEGGQRCCLCIHRGRNGVTCLGSPECHGWCLVARTAARVSGLLGKVSLLLEVGPPGVCQVPGIPRPLGLRSREAPAPLPPSLWDMALMRNFIGITSLNEAF